MKATAGFDVVAVVTRAVGLDVESAAPVELAWADRAADRLRAWVDAWQAEVEFRMTLPPPLPPDPADAEPERPPAADAGARDIPADQPAPDAEPLPSLGSHVPAIDSPREMLRKGRRMRLLADLPAFAEALKHLRITTGHVDGLAAAIEMLPDAIRIRVLARGDELLRAACQSTADRFTRTIQRVIAKAYDDEGIERASCQRQRSGLTKGVNDATGMHWLRVEIDPERGAVLFERLRNEREAIFHSGGHTGLGSEQTDLQALLNLMSVPGAEQKSSAKRAHVSVIVDIATLAVGAHDRSICETWSGVPLPQDTVRGLICAAEVEFGFTIAGRVLLHTSRTELATREQRSELRMMYRTCPGPCCNRPFDHCQVHHIIPRSRGGPTDVALMIPLCQRCHDLIHHRGWTLTIDEQRTLIWTAPDGHDTVMVHVGPADHGQPSLFDHPGA